MGSSGSRFRITRTDEEHSPWVGFCTVVEINEILEELCMPNGDKHKFVFINNGLKILEGEHKGFYHLEKLDLDGLD